MVNPRDDGEDNVFAGIGVGSVEAFDDFPTGLVNNAFRDLRNLRSLDLEVRTAVSKSCKAHSH